jgi:hypothetical protein
MQAQNRNNFLEPTKATLFGLDVRFRVIDKKIAEEKIKLMNGGANKTTSSSNTGYRNRHVLPALLS